MEERAQRLGGQLELRSVRGSGTTVRLEVGDG
jgi:signal transduction histidine kinase